MDPKPIRRALALDPSMTNTGWAVGCTDGSRPAWGAFHCPSWNNNEGKHLLRFRHWLWKMLADYRFDAVFFEAGFPGAEGYDAQAAKQMLFGEIIVFAEDHELLIRKVPIQSWRSLFIGATQAPPHFRKKPDMARQWLKERAISACAERGWLTDGDDEAEALGILTFGLAYLDPTYLARQEPLFRRTQLQRDRAGKVA